MKRLMTTAFAILVTALVGGCDQPKPAASAAPSPTSGTTNASPGLAPSAVAVNPSPSDAPKGSMTDRPTEAGSALGGTAVGNVSDPKPAAEGGAARTSAAPEPTGGDGTKASAKSEDDSKSTPSVPSK